LNRRSDAFRSTPASAPRRSARPAPAPRGRSSPRRRAREPRGRRRRGHGCGRPCPACRAMRPPAGGDRSAPPQAREFRPRRA
jgi:hypothetical protein